MIPTINFVPRAFPIILGKSPEDEVAKSTRIIHHNQLLMTEFGRILCLTRKLRQNCSLLRVALLRVKAPLPRRPGDEVELLWL